MQAKRTIYERVGGVKLLNSIKSTFGRNSVSQAETDRQRIDAERKKFIALAEQSVEFIGMCKPNFEPFYVNPAGLQIVGLDSVEQACTIKVQDVFFPEDQPFITNVFFPKVLREGHADVEIRFRHFKTGEAIWMLYNVFNLQDENGELLGWATLGRNIHDRKRSEAALAESEEKFRAIFHQAAVGIAQVAPDGTWLLVNEKLCQILGYTHDELLQRTFIDITHPDDLA